MYDLHCNYLYSKSEGMWFLQGQRLFSGVQEYPKAKCTSHGLSIRNYDLQDLPDIMIVESFKNTLNNLIKS